MSPTYHTVNTKQREGGRGNNFLNVNLLTQIANIMCLAERIGSLLSTRLSTNFCKDKTKLELQ